MNLTRYRSITWVLVVCLSFTVLTGCQLFKLEIVDPTEPVKLPAPLIDSITINVATKPGRAGESGWYKESESRLTSYFLTAMEKRLTDSGLAVTVQSSEKCLPGPHERTLCVTGTVSNYDTHWSFQRAVSTFWKSIVLILGLGIPFLFITHDLNDTVIAEAILLDKVGKERANFRVQSEFRVTSTQNPGNFRKAYSKNYEELSNRIVLELKRHPNWFEPVSNQTP